jgi:hypothetical protein
MAVRKSRIQKQVLAKMSEYAPPGEQYMVCFEAITGPSPWIDDLPYVRYVMLYLRQYYFVVLTNTSVVIVRASKITNRPVELVCAEHYSTADFADMRLSPLWSKVFYRMPNSGSVTRLNVHRRWRNELDTLVRYLGPRFSAQMQGAPADQQPQYPQQQPGQFPQQGQYQPGQFQQPAQYAQPGQYPQQQSGQYQQPQYPQQPGQFQ